jgi:1-acyl-sn-glycerol-3-phosphate acyltransferase
MKNIPHIFRFIWIIFWACIATIVLIVPLVISGIFTRTGILAFNLMRVWAWTALKSSGVHVRIKGKDNLKKLDKSHRYVIISNHQSFYDIPSLMALNLQLRWVIKKELLWIPLFGIGLYLSRNIFIDRSNHDKAIKQLYAGIDRLPPGVNVLFFPEGTRSPDGKLKSFKKGGFVLAIDKGLPVLPITINGSRKILPKKSLSIHPGTIEVVVSPPINTEDFTRQDLDQLMTKARNIMLLNFNPDNQQG